MSAKSIIVVGAGICGVSTAIWLLRSGHEVTLIDKDGPAAGASFGNAGLLAKWAVDPVTSPRLWRDAPGYLLNRDSGLFLSGANALRALPWLARFLSHATDRETRRIVGHLAPLLEDTVEQHRALVAGTTLERWICDSKMGFAYSNLRALQKDAYSWARKGELGLVPEVLTGGAVQEEEPILSPVIGCLAVLSGQGHILDPGGYITALVDHFVAEGGRFLKAELLDIHRAGGRISHVDTSLGVITCGALVLTTGIWSKGLMAKLGLNIPLQAERGYHVIFENPSETPRNPLLMMEGKFGVNPMEIGLRCAGTLEYAPHEAAPRADPIALLKRQAAKAFPGMTYSGTREWVGSRPSLPDSLPMIGEINRSGIYTGFGHQHVGLTTGPKTGRLIAQMISGGGVNLNLAPYAPERYTR